MPIFRMIFALSVASLTASSFACAQDATQRPAFAQRLFGAAARLKSYACFTRVYDAAHLAQHPLQKVSAMKLLVATEPGDPGAGPNYSFRLGVTYRDRRGNFDSSGDCGLHDDGKGQPRITCSVDCDGGGMEVRLTPDNKSAMLTLDRIRIWRDNHPDEDASYSLVAGADDRLFRLDRIGNNECATLVTDRKELAALRSVANRK